MPHPDFRSDGAFGKKVQKVGSLAADEHSPDTAEELPAREVSSGLPRSPLLAGDEELDETSLSPLSIPLGG